MNCTKLINEISKANVSFIMKTGISDTIVNVYLDSQSYKELLSDPMINSFLFMSDARNVPEKFYGANVYEVVCRGFKHFEITVNSDEH